jgi:hypothetical protein
MSMSELEVKEFDWIYLPRLGTSAPERTSTIRVILVVKDREFKRLFQWGYSPVWSEEGKPGFCKNEEAEELESIFKAWCISNNQDINDPVKLLNQPQ